MLSDVIQHFKYNITAKDGIFFIETEEENAKKLSHLLAGEFLTTIVRSFIPKTN